MCTNFRVVKMTCNNEGIVRNTIIYAKYCGRLICSHLNEASFEEELNSVRV